MRLLFCGWVRACGEIRCWLSWCLLVAVEGVSNSDAGLDNERLVKVQVGLRTSILLLDGGAVALEMISPYTVWSERCLARNEACLN